MTYSLKQSVFSRRSSILKYAVAGAAGLSFVALNLQDVATAWPRLALFALGAICGGAPLLGMACLVVLTPLLETLTLKYGFANQFLFENGWLGFALTTVMRQPLSLWRGSAKKILMNPLVVMIIALALFTAAKQLPQWLQLKSYSYQGLAYRKLFGFFSRNYWQWNEAYNPIHDLSIIIGLSILVFGLWAIAVNHSGRGKVSLSLLAALLLSSIPVHLMVYLQSAHGLIHQKISRDIGGAFQNGNVYSFYCGLMAIVAAYALSQCKRISTVLFSTVLLSATTLGLLAGRGRTSWVALACSAVFVAGIWLIHQLTQRKSRPSPKQLLGCTALMLLVGLTIRFGYTEFGLENFRGFREVSRLYDKLSFARFIDLGGRGKHFKSAWSLALQHPWVGTGYGAFMAKTSFRIGIHNQFLTFIVGCGWWMVLPMLAAFFLYLKQLIDVWRRGDLATALFGAAGFCYMALGHLFDHFFDYRPIAMIMLLVLSLPILKHPPRFAPVWLTAAVMALSIIMGLVSFATPHTGFALDQQWSWETNEQVASGRSRWNGPLLSRRLQPDQCIYLEVFPIHPSGHSTFQLNLSDKNPSQPMRLTDAERYFSEGGATKTLSVENGRWQTVCACQRPSFSEEKTFFSLLSNKGDYLSLSRHDFGTDDRFISFGVAEMKSIALETLSDQSCEHTLEWK